MMAKSEGFNSDRRLVPLGVTRRRLLPLLGASAVLPSVASASLAAASDRSEKTSGAKARLVYVCTYTAPGVPPGGTHPSTAVGIYVFKLHPSDGRLTLLQIV